MNRERVKKMLPIIQAFAEGETIQFFSGISVGWIPLGDYCSFSPDVEYRIKPEPRIFRMWRNKETGDMYESFTPHIEVLHKYELVILQEIIE